VSRRDNWKKTILRGLPDVLAWTPDADALERLWVARAEEEADLAASRGDRALGIEMAGALVKLARARATPGLSMALTFGAAGPIERRVRLLLEGARPPAEPGPPAWAPLALTVLPPAAACALFPVLSSRVHAGVEVLLRLLGA
jgi:hypothetical protein